MCRWDYLRSLPTPSPSNAGPEQWSAKCFPKTQSRGWISHRADYAITFTPSLPPQTRGLYTPPPSLARISFAIRSLEGDLDSPHTYQGIRPMMSPEFGATWTSCSLLKGCHCGHPRQEAQTAGSHRPGRIERLFTSPSTGSMRFRRTTRHHTSRFCDVTQIDFYAPGLIATMPSLYYGMRDENGSNYICAGSSRD